MLLTLINIEVSTNMTVKLTVTTASKKKSLKMFVLWLVKSKMIEGRMVVIRMLSSRLPRTISTLIARTPDIVSVLNSQSFMKYIIRSFGPE